jgi:hypothetical protein
VENVARGERLGGVHGSAVVKALRYKPGGCRFET